MYIEAFVAVEPYESGTQNVFPKLVLIIELNYPKFKCSSFCSLVMNSDKM